jgi:hypothetical protein
LKTAITLAVVIVANAAGNVVLGHGMRQVTGTERNDEFDDRLEE